MSSPRLKKQNGIETAISQTSETWGKPRVGWTFPKDGEELPVAGGGVGHPRIAEREGEDRGHRHEKDQRGDHGSRELREPGVLHCAGDEDGGQRPARLRLLPWNEFEHHRGHRDVNRRDHHDREQDGARHVALRVLDLARDVADLVVAAEAVHRDHRGRAERRPEAGVEALRRHERGKSRPLDEAGHDHPAGGGEDEGEHRLREALDGIDVPVEQEQHQHADARGGEVVREPRQFGEVEPEVVGEAHRAAGEGEGRHQQDVEQEQEGHEPAESERPERLPEIDVRPAAPRQRRPELGVDEAVGERQERAPPATPR